MKTVRTTLTPLAFQALKHWEEYLPMRVSRLKEAGTLTATLLEAERLTSQEMDELENAGYEPNEAREVVYPKYLFPPEEPETQAVNETAASMLEFDRQMNPLLEDETPPL